MVRVAEAVVGTAQGAARREGLVPANGEHLLEASRERVADVAVARAKSSRRRARLVSTPSGASCPPTGSMRPMASRSVLHPDQLQSPAPT